MLDRERRRNTLEGSTLLSYSSFFKFTEYLFRNIGKKEKLQDIHNSNEADRFILALFMSHVFIKDIKITVWRTSSNQECLGILKILILLRSNMHLF
jgi:hypothetical protein